MTVERRIRITAWILILFALGTAALLFWSSRLVENGIRGTESASQVVRSAFMLTVLMEQHLVQGDKRTLRQWDMQREALGQTLNEMNSESVDRALLTDLKNKYQAVNSLSPQFERIISNGNDYQNEDRKVRELLIGLMLLRLEKLVNAASDLSRTTYILTLNRRHIVQEIIVAIAVSMVVVILINIYLIRQSVVQPLKELSAGAERIGAGNFDYVAETKRDDEVGKLAQAFNAMIGHLQERTAALRKARDELEIKVEERTAELRSANEILGHEIEDRKRAEQSLTVERQRLYDILETMPVMVCLLTADYHVSFANRSFREKFGEDNGRHCFDYCFGLKEPCEFCESYNVLTTGKPHHWEVRSPDGSIIDSYDFPFTDTDGSPLILEIDIDVTEQRRAQEMVTAERQRLYDVLETLPVYVCLLDANYHMPFANRYFRETFGESLGRQCHEFLFNRTEPCETCETYTVMKTRAPHHWYWTGPNGRDYDIYDFPFMDTDGSFLILEMGIDITERNQAENALKQTFADLTRSNQDLHQFAYVASHDLQEPLRNIAGCLQLLEKKYKNKLDAEADQYIYYAIDSASRMKTLIQDLLAYSRIATRGKPLTQINCEHILYRVMTNLSSTIAEAGAVITHDPLPTISGDDTQLSQVFQNLIQNAIKFRRDEPPQIHVSAVKDNNEWTFSVRDNGIGMEPRHLDRIFVIFQRLHKRSHYEGTGMGLAIVKKVVERHGGRVWVESEPGVGTTFYFTIPEKGLQI